MEMSVWENKRWRRRVAVGDCLTGGASLVSKFTRGAAAADGWSVMVTNKKQDLYPVTSHYTTSSTGAL